MIAATIDWRQDETPLSGLRAPIRGARAEGRLIMAIAFTTIGFLIKGRAIPALAAYFNRYPDPAATGAPWFIRGRDVGSTCDLAFRQSRRDRLNSFSAIIRRLPRELSPSQHEQIARDWVDYAYRPGGVSVIALHKAESRISGTKCHARRSRRLA